MAKKTTPKTTKPKATAKTAPAAKRATPKKAEPKKAEPDKTIPAKAAPAKTNAPSASSSATPVETPKTAVETKSSTPAVQKKETIDTKPDLKKSTDDAQTVAVVAPQPNPPKRPSVFFPMVLGGLVAGGIGYAAATYLPEYLGTQEQDQSAIALQNAEQKIAEQNTTINALKEAVAALQAEPKTSELEPKIAALQTTQADVSTKLGELASNTTAYADRITSLEKRPMNDALSKEAIAAYENELASLKAAVESQQQNIQQVAADATAQIESALEDAAKMETQAVEISRKGEAQAALLRIQAALENGSSFDAILGEFSELTDLEIPAELSQAAAIGVATIPSLQDDVPDLARSALAVARSESPASEDESGLSSFLKSQLGVRSLTPQDGDGPDAVLSRIEFAAKDARFSDALAEMELLPPAAQAVFADWKANVENRQLAISAADKLSAALTLK